MTRYEGYETNGWTTVDKYLCTGWMNMDFTIETAPRPDDPKMIDWFVTVDRCTDTTCYTWFKCSRKAIDLVNYGIPGNHGEYTPYYPLAYGHADDDPRHPNIPRIPKWPAPQGDRKLPNGNTLRTFKTDFKKAFYLGCCSDACSQSYGGDDVICNTFTLNGTVNPDDLPDPLTYNGVDPASFGWIQVDKVAAHAYLEAMKQLPSWLTMHGPTGFSGSHPLLNRGHSHG